MTKLDRKADNCGSNPVAARQCGLPSDSTSIGLEFPNEYRKHRHFNGNDLSLYSSGKGKKKKKPGQGEAMGKHSFR